jgi:hypothetical protein
LFIKFIEVVWKFIEVVWNFFFDSTGAKKYIRLVEGEKMPLRATRTGTPKNKNNYINRNYI